MARDILSDYGPERTMGSRASNGGKMPVSDGRYSPPTGPIGISHNSPGLGGSNFGNGQKPTGAMSSGRAGIGGEICCPQGKR